MKLTGEDYMGESYDGYIPGALDHGILHSDGILPFIANIFPIDKVGPYPTAISMIRNLTPPLTSTLSMMRTKMVPI